MLGPVVRLTCGLAIVASMAACQARVATGGKTFKEFVADRADALSAEDIDAKFTAAAKRFPALRHRSDPGYTSYTYDSAWSNSGYSGTQSANTVLERRLQSGVLLKYQSSGTSSSTSSTGQGSTYEFFDGLLAVRFSSQYDDTFTWTSIFEIKNVTGNLFPMKTGNRMEIVWKSNWLTTSGYTFNNTTTTTLEVVGTADASSCNDVAGVTVSPTLPGRFFMVNQTFRTVHQDSTIPASTYSTNLGYSPELGLVIPCGLGTYETRHARRYVLSQERIAEREARRGEILASLKRDFIEENAQARIVVANAAVMAMPDEKSYEVDSYPKGSVVHVIGRLPSGWAQLARQGKPLGWTTLTSLKLATGQATGQTAAPATKPSIFLAYPKGDEEIADDSVKFLGYVTSDNRTKTVTVFVNKLPLSLDHLWTDAAIATAGLRGFPLDLTVPLQPGMNRIELQVLDQAGFLEKKIVTVNSITLNEQTTSAPSPTSVQARLANMEIASSGQAMTSENFMAVLGDWVKNTAKSDYNKGNAMFDEGRYVRAAYYYRKAIKTEPSGQAWFNLGISEMTLGNVDKAKEALSTACRMNVSQACDGAS